MHEYNSESETASTPMSSLPMTTGTAPVDSSQLAGASLSSTVLEKSQAGKHGQPRSQPLKRDNTIFLTQDQVGKLLGYSAKWLRKQALRHPLYAPTNKPANKPNHKGSRVLYSREHVAYILKYMTNPDLVTENYVYKKWMEKRQAEISKFLADDTDTAVESATEPQQPAGRRSRRVRR